MIFKLFSLYDAKADAFMQPFFQPNLAVAKRAVARSASDPNSDMCAYIDDYTLFELGEWEPDSGKLRVLDAPFNHGSIKLFASNGAAIPDLRQALEIK